MQAEVRSAAAFLLRDDVVVARIEGTVENGWSHITSYDTSSLDGTPDLAAKIPTTSCSTGKSHRRRGPPTAR